jgi:hypothetical protein
MKKRSLMMTWATIILIALSGIAVTSCEKDDETSNGTTNSDINVEEAQIHATVTDPASLCPDANHPHLIDLGIGVKWLCCNVGTNKPEGYGDYFAWGESKNKKEYWKTEPSKANKYSWDSYPYYTNGSAKDIGEDISGLKTTTRTDQYYNENGTIGTKEVKDTLDAAFYEWDKKYKEIERYKDNSWRMPQLADLQTLLTQCESEWTKVNGIVGRKFIGPNGNCIFMPASGRYIESTIHNKDAAGYYWTATIRKGEEGNTSEKFNNLYAHYLCISYKTVEDYYYWERYIGRTIRGVSE